MKKLLISITFMVLGLGMAFGQQRATKVAVKPKGLVVAFFDETRLRAEPGGQAALENYSFFFKQIQEIARRDFPDVDVRILRRGDLIRLYDGTALNVQNMQPALGYVFSMRGKKRRIITGVQSEADFACTASAYFRRSSPACIK
jgi:hypothetical protein